MFASLDNLTWHLKLVYCLPKKQVEGRINPSLLEFGIDKIMTAHILI